ncbi:hypothetical protein GGR51DRAFT_512982 [Nemania sp. FL0031]|nr:hypothetical protein GGR51DRAFT_512982 [Nemania sp. FL0031]
MHTSAKKFWYTVIQLHPPRQLYNTAKIMNHFTSCRPMDKPSNSKIWKTAKAWLQVARQGADQS